MPESFIPKPNYLFCQFVYPESGHDGGPCDCFHTPSQKRTTRAKARLARLRANKGRITRASTSNTQKSTVASDPAVTVLPFGLSRLCLGVLLWGGRAQGP